jgi:microcystin-dependent protein
MPKTTLLRKQVTPTGTIQPHAGGTAPDGFLVCDGTIVDIADYPKLFAVIGTSWGYGNNDGLTFHLPDLRGRFLRGSTKGMTPAEAALRDPDYASRTPSNTGGNSGDAVGSVQDDVFEGHTHATYFGGIGGGTLYPEDPYISNQFAGQAHNVSNTGGNETRPVNANVTYVIKVV